MDRSDAWAFIAFQVSTASSRIKKQESMNMGKLRLVRNCGNCHYYDGGYCFGFDPRMPRPKGKTQSCGKHRYPEEVRGHEL